MSMQTNAKHIMYIVISVLPKLYKNVPLHNYAFGGWRQEGTKYTNIKAYHIKLHQSSGQYTLYMSYNIQR